MGILSRLAAPAKLKNKKSFTLIELIFEIVVIAIIIIPSAILLVEFSLSIIQTENYTTATALSVQKAEQIMWNYSFSNVPTIGNFTPFVNPPGCTTCHYDEYSYTVGWQYVTAADLDTPAAVPPTDYKKVTITVRNARIPDVILYLLFTNI